MQLCFKWLLYFFHFGIWMEKKSLVLCLAILLAMHFHSFSIAVPSFVHFFDLGRKAVFKIIAGNVF